MHANVNAVVKVVCRERLVIVEHSRDRPDFVEIEH
jgi:hypothetical protein|tara:strand:+ start:5198 stop:5302 length:105 start_codon:yes stop_codon:yes gene_type:complete